MSTQAPTESSLLVMFPAAEIAVAPYRARYDKAAQVGVPAHITVAYPFKPAEQLTEADHATLSSLFARIPQFNVTCAGTGWFGDDVIFLTLEDAQPVVSLTRAVQAAFPEFPIYGGAFNDVVPHLTIARNQPSNLLREAERNVRPHLPVMEAVLTVELWSGPASASGQGPGTGNGPTLSTDLEQLLFATTPRDWRQIRMFAALHPESRNQQSDVSNNNMTAPSPLLLR